MVRVARACVPPPIARPSRRERRAHSHRRNVHARVLWHARALGRVGRPARGGPSGVAPPVASYFVLATMDSFPSIQNASAARHAGRTEFVSIDRYRAACTEAERTVNGLHGATKVYMHGVEPQAQGPAGARSAMPRCRPTPSLPQGSTNAHWRLPRSTASRPSTPSRRGGHQLPHRANSTQFFNGTQPWRRRRRRRAPPMAPRNTRAWGTHTFCRGVEEQEPASQ